MSGAVEEVAGTARVAEEAVRRFESGRGLRRNLGGGGRLHLDRALPFLAVYRPPGAGEDPGAATLVSALSAYLSAGSDEETAADVAPIVEGLARASRERFGGFLLLEVWVADRAGDGGDDGGDGGEPPTIPGAVLHPSDAVSAETVDAFAGALRELRLSLPNGCELGVPRAFESVEVAVGEPGAPGRPALADAVAGGPALGLAVSPFFRAPGSARLYPRVLDALRAGLAEALERGLFHFAHEETSLDPPHFRALGRRRVGRAEGHVDRRLAEVYGAFDVLLQVTPTNTEEAWASFRDAGYERGPELGYRPLPFDPERMKRRLFDVPLERVEDPLLGQIFREKQEELDREITLLRELGTPRFRHASLQLHGVVDDALHELAEAVLERLSASDPEAGPAEYAEEGEPDRSYVDAEAFARAAKEEIDRYRRIDPTFAATVRIRDDVTAGLMVSRDELSVSRSLRVPERRVEALIHHEVGTHLVTYCNGLAQPLRVFSSGLAGYETLQEGIAVLSEYLVGGLTPQRMRVLAGRVVGVRAMQEGADFVETFRLLRSGYGFQDRTAFLMTVRIHRGGGLSKDAAYLRGLRDLLTHLRDDGALDPLFVGKLGLDHIVAAQELVLRGVLGIPTVKPRYTNDLAAMERLGACRRMTALDLADRVRETWSDT